jgi:hypothetical protein
MKQPHNFIDVQNATTLGATTPSPHYHFKKSGAQMEK